MKPTWRPGKQPGTVVTDRIADGPELASHIDFYGGYLVAESIAPENVGPISATVDLLEAAKELLAIAYASGRGGIVEFRPHEFDDLADAVAKAEKKTGDSMSYDLKCKELAEHFLFDKNLHKDSEAVRRIAQVVQDAAESEVADLVEERILNSQFGAGA